MGVLPTSDAAVADAPVRSPARREPARVKALVAEHFAFIWRLLRRLGLPADAADDAAQQVFLVAVERITDIRPGSERSFLFGTALRVASARRRLLARERADDRLEPYDPLPPPDELTNQKRLREMFDAILDRMDEDVRVTFVLIEVEGLTVPEASELLGIPGGTVASRLRRGREFFEAESKRIEARGVFRGGRP
jgi:RNA polymerase sigma-70 factor (ECF subfamily)